MGDRAVNALLGAAACVAGLVALYLAAFELGATERADERVLDGFLSLSTPSTWAAASFVSHFFNERPYAVAVLIVMVAALWLGRLRMAVAVGVVCLGANLTTQALKLLTAAPREPMWLPDASFPSGHLTAATSLALCVVLVAPVALRPYAVVAGALGVLATAYSILVIGSHHPSDVAGGMLVAGAWTGVVVAVLERGRAATGARRRTALAGAGSGGDLGLRPARRRGRGGAARSAPGRPHDVPGRRPAPGGLRRRDPGGRRDAPRAAGPQPLSRRTRG